MLDVEFNHRLAQIIARQNRGMSGLGCHCQATKLGAYMRDRGVPIAQLAAMGAVYGRRNMPKLAAEMSRPSVGSGLGDIGAVAVKTPTAIKPGSQSAAAQAGKPILVYKKTNIVRTVPKPVTSGGKKIASGLHGLGATAVTAAAQSGYKTAAISGSIAGAVGTAAATGILGGAAAGAAAGSFFPVVGTVIGAIVGIAIGLFSRHKPKPIPISQADINQAHTFINQYMQVEGTVLGRAMTEDQLRAIGMSIYIVSEGELAHAGSMNAATQDWVELKTRFQDFFTAMQAANVGDTVTLKDNCSLLGHGGKSCHMDKTYEFQNPGVNAPSDVLGAFFAQFYYTMCAIFQNDTICTARTLVAPAPQFYTDAIDWFRSTRPQWDVIAPVTATPIASTPTLSAPQLTQAAQNALQTVVAAPPPVLTNVIAPTAGQVSTVQSALPIAPPAAAGPIATQVASNLMTSQGVDMSSPDAQQLMTQATQEGITQTAPVVQHAGFTLPEGWTVPVLAILGIGFAFAIPRRRSKGN